MKRAEVRTYAILIVLAVFLIIFLLLFYNRTAIAQRLDTIFPNFGFANQSTEQTQILRYSILEDKIEWYDGTKFNTFANGELKLRNSRTLNENQVKLDFSNFYFNNNLQPLSAKPLAQLNLGPTIYPESSMPTQYCLEADYQGTYPLKLQQSGQDYRLVHGNLYTGITFDLISEQGVEVSDSRSATGKKIVFYDIYYDGGEESISFFPSSEDTKIKVGEVIGEQTFDGKIEKYIIFSFVGGESSSIFSEVSSSRADAFLKYRNQIENIRFSDLQQEKINAPEFLTLSNEIQDKDSIIKLTQSISGQCTDNILGVFVKKADGDLKFFGIDKKIYQGEGERVLSSETVNAKEKWPSIYNLITKHGDDWRDQILKTPLTIHFSENANGPLEQTYCAQKYDGKYLVIDLNKPQTQC